jgi:hypothetical protein
MFAAPVRINPAASVWKGSAPVMTPPIAVCASPSV